MNATENTDQKIQFLLQYLPEAEQAIEDAGQIYYAVNQDADAFRQRCKVEIVLPRLAQAMSRFSDARDGDEIMFGALLVTTLLSVAREIFAEFVASGAGGSRQ